MSLGEDNYTQVNSVKRKLERRVIIAPTRIRTGQGGTTPNPRDES